MIELPDKIEAGTEIEIQLAPFGKYMNKKRLQVIDSIAVDQMVAAFGEEGKEVLVDRDHGSLYDTCLSEAMAWIVGLRADPVLGLVATMKFTDIGADAVAERHYRYISPVWNLDKNGRPIKVISAGLTNTPNLPAKPVANRQSNEKDTQMNERLIELLGLDAEAGEDAIFDAVNALKTRVGELEAAAADAEAETFANENEELVDDPEKLKEQYKSDPELTKAVLANCRKERHALANSARPVLKGSADVDIGKQLSMIPPKDRQAYFNNHQ